MDGGSLSNSLSAGGSLVPRRVTRDPCRRRLCEKLRSQKSSLRAWTRVGTKYAVCGPDRLLSETRGMCGPGQSRKRPSRAFNSANMGKSKEKQRLMHDAAEREVWG